MKKFFVFILTIIFISMNFISSDLNARPNVSAAVCKVAVRECSSIIEGGDNIESQLETCKTCCTNTTNNTVISRKCTKRCLKACEKKFRELSQ